MSAEPDNVAFLKGYDAVSPTGAVLLANVEQYIGRFVAYPNEHARVAHTLWIAHAHAMEAFESTPRLAFLSPEPGSGKTRALELTETLVPRPVANVNATPAYLFRKVSDPAGLPTILFDEIDTLFGPRAKEHEEVRGILNAGHRRGAVAGRCVVKGKTVETEELPAYCAVALAGLGNLPDTILTRSVVVKMRRRAPSEHVEPYRRRIHAPAGNALRHQLAEWLGDFRMIDYPEMPAGVEDRAADVWEPLLAIADLAGGDWPSRARVAAVAHVAQAREGNPSLGVRLLADIKLVFKDQLLLPTQSIIDALIQIEEAPWSDLRGRALDARRLANYLQPYGVVSKRVRIGPAVLRGYARTDFYDAWTRYLPAPPTTAINGSGSPSIEGATSATPATPIAFARSCPDCDGSGCSTCGEFKAADGTELGAA